MVKEFTVQLTAEGLRPIPESIRRELGLRPLQTVYLQEDIEHGQLIIQSVARQQIADKVVALMSAAFEGVTWADIQVGRYF